MIDAEAVGEMPDVLDEGLVGFDDNIGAELLRQVQAIVDDIDADDAAADVGLEHDIAQADGSQADNGDGFELRDLVVRL